MDIAFATAAQLAQAYRARTLSAVEATTAILDRIDRLNPTLNAFVRVADRESCLAVARAADAAFAAGWDPGPLAGIPIGLKDLIDMAGYPTTAGSQFLGDHPAATDAPVAARLRAAGAVLLGKQHLHEFAVGGPVNTRLGVAQNPWGQNRYTGGSSSGSGVAVAAGLGAAAIGSDTAGSIRFPAAYCGVTGIKPTQGRVPTRGCFPLAWSYDHFGPLTRSAEDAAIVLGALAGFDPLDSSSVRAPRVDFVAGLHGGVRGVRIGVPVERLWGAVEASAAGAVRLAIRELEKLGAVVSEVELPEVEECSDLIGPLLWPEAAAVHAVWYPARAAEYGDLVRARLDLGLATGVVEHVDALQRRRDITRRLGARMEAFDALAMPTVPFGAPLVADVRNEVRPARLQWSWPFNLTGFPALSAPCGFNAEGMPIGLQLAGKAWDEATILRIAHTLQQATDWHLRVPPLAA